MGQPNPFDFSDFGPAKRPSGPTPPPAGPGAPAPGAPAQPGHAGGFDPWAGQPAAQPRPGQDAFGQLPGQDAFGQAGTTGGALATAGPPLQWFAIALALAVAGVVMAAIGALAGGNIATALAGWLLAGPIAIGALAVYNRVDTRRRTEAIYSAPTWAATLYWTVLAVCLIGIAVGAWQIALWAGRQ